MSWHIGNSEIHGKGVFSSKTFDKDKKIGIGIEYYFLGIIPIITKNFGSMINHSYNPTAKLIYNKEDNTWDVYSKNNILKNVEITLDYRDTPWFVEGPKNWYV